jgi:hypothetical protein|tara:strand:+ start:610 stop:861 length:252 start_codon:yes stop_codon:yes gene_type:complete
MEYEANTIYQLLYDELDVFVGRDSDFLIYIHNDATVIAASLIPMSDQDVDGLISACESIARDFPYWDLEISFDEKNLIDIRFR